MDAQWIVESYALMLAALILVGGSLGDHYGRRRPSDNQAGAEGAEEQGSPPANQA